METGFVLGSLSKLCKSENELLEHVARDLPRVGEALGFEMENIEREVRVGSFLSDRIVKCKDGRVIVIEAQLGESNHDHIGKLFTYVAGQKANMGFLICERARLEHIEALKIFGQGKLQLVEAYSGNRHLAYKVISRKPSRTLSTGSGKDWTGGMSYKEFWEGFKTYALDNGVSELRNRNPRKDSTGFTIPIGILGIDYAFGLGASTAGIGLRTPQVAGRELFRKYKSDVEYSRFVDAGWATGFVWEKVVDGHMRNKEDWPKFYKALVELYLEVKGKSREFVDYVGGGK